jgi:hypothetical protein
MVSKAQKRLDLLEQMRKCKSNWEKDDTDKNIVHSPQSNIYIPAG